ncbi:MAG: exodeoxyribonuclease VII large subunit [Alphaproteobacteria bacterium]|nr:exodeoxyribonuclease VII large subunit [Alphaproteobacteria bacterium]
MDEPVVFSVGEISTLVRQTMEGAFPEVAVRGEVFGAKRNNSGHVYFALKDKENSLSAVCWRGNAETVFPLLKEGLEVVCYGRISAYGATSHYQLIVSRAEPAGQGALLQLLQERKEKLQKEGLFDPARKKPLPFLPSVIGVITSPTGAVIRDIMHRLDERFARHVVLWPVAVQGDGAAEQICQAVSGFNAIPAEGLSLPSGLVPRPNLLIVARGGGSLEDLWCFNEENVARAVAASDIPVISAVGHETDTTLIDFVSDLRAPTPTAAAEIAVPVRSDLQSRLLQQKRALIDKTCHILREKKAAAETLKYRMPSLSSTVEQWIQRLDDKENRLRMAWKNLFGQAQARLNATKNLLDAVSYVRVLEKGFALVTDHKNNPLTRAESIMPNKTITLHFADGQIKALTLPQQQELFK